MHSPAASPDPSAVCEDMMIPEHLIRVKEEIPMYHCQHV